MDKVCARDVRSSIGGRRTSEEGRVGFGGRVGGREDNEDVRG